jgi:hypothetical protein
MVPGFAEINLVSQDGSNYSEVFALTVSLTDANTWVQAATSASASYGLSWDGLRWTMAADIGIRPLAGGCMVSGLAPVGCG